MSIPPDLFTMRTRAQFSRAIATMPVRNAACQAPDAEPSRIVDSSSNPPSPSLSTETDNTASSVQERSGIAPFLARLLNLLRPASPFFRTAAFACLATYAGTRVDAREAVIVDHTYDLTKVPESAFEAVRANSPVVHFAHRSDGTAVPWGMRILDRRDHIRFPYSVETGKVPVATRGLRFWDGMGSETYVTPERYWNSPSGLRELAGILQGHPEIRYTTWTFCDEDDSWSWSDDPAQNDYIRVMDSLEKVFPQVTFIYQTAAMRPVWNAEGNVNQALFNEGLRSWARRNGKVLFDFADLDVWHDGDYHTERMTYTASGTSRKIDTSVAIQHPYWRENNGPTTGWHHANDSMGLDKARAWWYLMARLEGGWSPTTILAERSASAPHSYSVIPGRDGWIVRGPAVDTRAILLDVTGREISRHRFAGELALARLPAASAGLLLRIVPSDGSAPSILRLPPVRL